MKKESFEEKIEKLKSSSQCDDEEKKAFDGLPSDFSQITKNQLAALWKFLPDSLIGWLYGVPKDEVKKKRVQFDINQINSLMGTVLKFFNDEKN